MELFGRLTAICDSRKPCLADRAFVFFGSGGHSLGDKMSQLNAIWDTTNEPFSYTYCCSLNLMTDAETFQKCKGGVLGKVSA